MISFKYCCLLWIYAILDTSDAIDNDDDDIVLPFDTGGSIHLIALTDVHSWFEGHGYHPDATLDHPYDVDFGDVLSFYQQYEKKTNHDVFLVTNGNWLDGTGLSNDIAASTSLMEKMPWDVVNIGRSEISHDGVVEYATRPGGFVSWFDQELISSNTKYRQEPLGSQYRLLIGKHSTLLVFGFTNDDQDDQVSSLIQIESIQQVIQQTWFTRILKQHKTAFDAILVMMADDDGDDLHLLLDAMRHIVPETMPIQFIAGNDVRNHVVLDPACRVFQPGRDLDTVGVVSFPTQTKYLENKQAQQQQAQQQQAQVNATSNNTSIDASDLFRHAFLDANEEVLKRALRLDDLSTSDGTKLSHFVHQARTELGLDDVVGCTPRYQKTLRLNRTLDNKEDSLWNFFLFMASVMKVPDDPDVIMLLPKSLWRFDLPSGHVRVDDIYGVAPSNETMIIIGQEIRGPVVAQFQRMINEFDDPNLPLLPNYIAIGNDDDQDLSNLEDVPKYKIVTCESHADSLQQRLNTLHIKGHAAEIMSSTITTTSIWFDYIAEHWSCDASRRYRDGGDRTSDQDEEQDGAIIGLSIACAMTTLIIMIGVLVWTRTGDGQQVLNRRQYTQSAVDQPFVESAASSISDNENELI